MKDFNVETGNNSYSSIDGLLLNKNGTSLICCPISKTEVTIPNSVNSIGKYAFYNCKLKNITIPETVNSIGAGAFSCCENLISVSMPNTVTKIEDSMFDQCIRLEDVTIPNTVTYIGNYAFDDCESLHSIIIPSLTSYIGKDAFRECKLYTIYYMSKQPIECNPGFNDTTLKQCTLCVPTGSKEEFEKVDPWRNFWNIEEMDFSGIEEISQNPRPSITVKDGNLITNEDAYTEVYDLQGRTVFSGNTEVVPNLKKGIYIVKSGEQVIKVHL